MDLRNDINSFCLFVFPDKVEIIDDTHFEWIRKNNQAEYEALLNSGLTGIEAEHKIRNRLLSEGVIQIGRLRNDYYAVVWKLDKRAKEVILDFCESTVKTRESVRDKLFTIHQKCGNIKSIAYYIKDILDKDYLKLNED
jgi:hypothetical protein